MALRSGHGTGTGRPHIEVLPADELPPPVPAATTPASPPILRRRDGKLADVASAKELGRRGGEAKARRVRLVDSLGLSKLAASSAFGAYRHGAEEFTAHHLGQLAQQAGGIVGAAPSTMVASAALQLAGSRFAFDRFAATSDPDWLKLGSSLANDSRQNLLAAYELSVREAKARAAAFPSNPSHALAAGLNGGGT